MNLPTKKYTSISNTSYTVLFLLAFCITLSAQTNLDNWPNWRGPYLDGVSVNGAPPIEWSETKNIKWKTPIPGKGVGTPVIWSDQLFITTAIELDQKATEEAIKILKDKTPALTKLTRMAESTENFLQFVVYSINRNNGTVNWKKIVREQYPHEGINSNGSWASASCVTDGEILIASFGSYGIYCFDLSGKLLWEKDLGDMQIAMTFGEGISPVLYKNKLIILWDHEGQSKVYVFDSKSGDEIWHKDRDEATAWVTPVVIEFNNKAQIIVPGHNKSRGYDLQSGDVIWEVGGLGEGPICCPVFDGERAYLMTGYGSTKIIQAIDLKMAEENSGSSSPVIWSSDQNTSYVPSPLLKDGKLYYLKGSRALLSCVDAKSGEVHYEALKPDGLGATYASPIAANGNIYILDRRGNSALIKEGVDFKVVAVNKLDDGFDASPVVVGKELFLRGYKSLYCISE